jgi:hypothetical protein
MRYIEVYTQFDKNGVSFMVGVSIDYNFRQIDICLGLFTIVIGY